MTAFFHDAQHPNLHGYVALAEDVMNQLAERHAFSWPAGTPVPVVDPEVCARHFGIDAARWAKVASRDVWFFRAAAYIRYDPRFRNERASEYLRAIAAIGGGCALNKRRCRAGPCRRRSRHRTGSRTGRVVNRKGPSPGSGRADHYFSRERHQRSRAARTGFALPWTGRMSRNGSVVRTRRRPTAAA